MATVIRLSRQGRKNRPHYRLGVFDRRTRRDGPPIEHLGHYDPLVESADEKVKLNEERIRYWLSQGADVSDTVASFLRRKGIERPVPAKKKKNKRKKKA
ncbi:MAG: 30S ribosomal protein S16 [Planctomycetota bacterium]|nr:30S ribosomal protein S16 [Planctomycetota bacterium]